jgi:glycosyltransferase involved in cell wall biosynthesis
MRIAVVSRSRFPAPYASALSVIQTSQAFADEGHDVSLFGVASNGAEERDLFEFYRIRGGFDVVLLRDQVVRGIQGLRYGRRVSEQLRAMGPFDFAFGRSIHVLLLAPKGLPTVFEVPLRTSRFPRDLPHRTLYRRSTFLGIAAVCARLRSDLISQYRRLDPERVVVAYNGANVVHGDAVSRFPDWPGRPGHYQAGYAGAAFPGKGAELPFHLAHRLPDVDFHVIGVTPQAYSSLVAGGDVPANLHVHGHVPAGELSSRLVCLDCFLVPQARQVTMNRRKHSAESLFPLKIFDGMAHGLAICASDFEVIREVLEDRTDALLLPPDNLDAWVRGIDSLARDPAYGRRLGEGARRKFEAGYTWRHRVRTILALASSGVEADGRHAR